MYLLTGGELSQLVHDPTGTSGSPALDARGQHLAFASRGDLAATGNAGASQVFAFGVDRVLRQVRTSRS